MEKYLIILNTPGFENSCTYSEYCKFNIREIKINFRLKRHQLKWWNQFFQTIYLFFNRWKLLSADHSNWFAALSNRSQNVRLPKKSLTCIHLERLKQDKVYFYDMMKSNVPQHSKQKTFKRFRNWKLAFSSVTKYQLIVCFGSRQPNNSIINRSPKIIGISVLKHSKTNKVQ